MKIISALVSCVGFVSNF